MTDAQNVSAITGTSETVVLTAEEVTEIESQQLTANQVECKALKAELAVSDAYMARMCEDLINILVDNGTIALSDFAQSAQDKLAERTQLRADIATLEE